MKEKLEKTGAIMIIEALKGEAEPLNLTVLGSKVHCSGKAMRSAVDVLAELGIVNVEASKGPPMRTLVTLTKKGERVAEKLDEIEQILNVP